MFKKAFAAIAVAGLLVLGGASAASADPYPPSTNISASDTTPAVGAPITITATGLGDLPVVFFSVTPSNGASLASIVAASASAGLEKPVVNGSASVQFTAQREGTFTVSVSDGTQVIRSITLEVGAVGAGGGSNAGDGSDGLPPTGGTVAAAYVWLGVGALGLGGIAVAAAAARRRASANR